MPNRGELPVPAARAAAKTPQAGEVLTVIGFCAIGWLMSIFLAVSAVGVNAVPRLLTQFPGLAQFPGLM